MSGHRRRRRLHVRPIAANFDPHLIGAEYAYSAKADDLLPIYDADPKEEML